MYKCKQRKTNKKKIFFFCYVEMMSELQKSVVTVFYSYMFVYVPLCSAPVEIYESRLLTVTKTFDLVVLGNSYIKGLCNEVSLRSLDTKQRFTVTQKYK